MQPRWLLRRDLAECLEIEKKTRKEPWEEEDFLGLLKQRNYIGKIIEKNEMVIGFSIYLFHRNKLEIIRLSIHPEYQREGVGTMFTNHLKDKLSQQRRTEIEIAVDEYNDVGILFLTSQEFRAVGIEKDEQGNTIYIFRYNLFCGNEDKWETKNRIASYLEL